MQTKTCEVKKVGISEIEDLNHKEKYMRKTQRPEDQRPKDQRPEEKHRNSKSSAEKKSQEL